MIPEHNFKVGDKVKIISTLDLYIGEIRVITRIDEFIWMRIFSPEKENAVHPDWIRLVTPLEELL